MSCPISRSVDCLRLRSHDELPQRVLRLPYFDALSEALVKAPERGAVAAISPSGLSLSGRASIFHESLLDQILHRGHEKLGDAFLAAQRDFAGKSSYRELLELYHLFGDPALTLR